VSSNQDEGEKGKEANSNMVFEDNDTCDHHIIMPWDYEGENVIYLSSEEEGEYHMYIVKLSEDLLFKEIPMAFYVNIKHVMDREQVFITWDHNGVNVKYLSFMFEGAYVLDVTNMLEGLLDEDILGELHVYDTHDYFSIIYMTIKTMLIIKMPIFIMNVQNAHFYK
jgi:hypothetical protein